MEIQVLGPVAAVHEDAELDLGPRLRRLLAALVLDRGRVVSTDRLVDIVWGGSPPDQAEKTLKTYLTRLRNTVDPDRVGLIDFRPPGYVLELGDVSLDSDRFEYELDEGLACLRAGEQDDAVGLLRGGLDRWRGSAYAGFADEEWARPEALRLEECRVEATQALIEGWISTGAFEKATGEARALSEAEPFRDRPRELLMRALYAAGRQTDALREYRRYRALLAEETGLEPSAELVDVEARLARSDPSLSTPVRALRGYRLGERIGAGAHATVHRAVQPGIEREVAIKIIRSELADRPEFVRRFEHEAQIVASVEHPHVVPLYDYWREPGSAYLVMRLMRGGSVEEALRTRGPYSQRAATELLRDVGAALEAAHRVGVVHRDVRPGNLMLDDEGAVYLADFGIAVESATTDDLPVLSPAHASPEVLRGEPAAKTSDVLSLGVTAFEMLTGRLPFADSTDRAEIIRRQLTEPLPSARATRTDLPAAVDEVLARATAKVPEDRYSTVAAFVEDIAAVLDGAASGSSPAEVAPRGEIDNPYVGLHAFEEADEHRFFGREVLVAELVEALAEHPFAVVVGPSGCGKSSIVRAGLLPAIRRGALPDSDRWYVTTMLPGADPIDALETALLRVAVNPPASLRVQLAEDGGLLRAVRRVLPDDDARLLLVVDQLEELFTLTGSADERTRLLTELAAAITAPGSPLRVVATLRADHYDAPLCHPGFARLVTEGTVTVRPMAPDELERSIVLPAQHVGVEIERALVAELVAGVSERPAALPLLQFSLTETFERRVSGVMLASVHHDLGGLTGAVAARADRIIDEGGQASQAAARRIFGRLVTLGEGVEDTRRRARRAEIGSDEHTAWLLDAFGSARLLTFDHDPSTREPMVEVAHEAMLRDWPRLRRWLDEDRADLRARLAISQAATSWKVADCDPTELARGGRLEIATELAERRPDLLNDDERAFIDESQAAEVAREQERTEAIQRDRRQNRRLRTLLAITGLLLVVALIATGGALVLRERAVDSERIALAAESEAEANAAEADANAATAEANAAEADANAAEADANAAEADANAAEADANAAEADAAREDAEIERLVAQSAAQLDIAPDRAILLALEANRRRDDVATQTAVHRSIATEPRRIAIFPSRTGVDDRTRFAPGGSIAASLGPSSAVVEAFDPVSGEQVWTHDTGAPVIDGVLSGDGSVAALGVSDNTIVVVDRAGQPIGSVESSVGGYIIALDGTGDRLVHVAPDSFETRIVDVATQETIATYEPDQPSRRPERIALSADGSMLAIVWQDIETGSWGVDLADSTGQLVRRVDAELERGRPTAVALGADGLTVAVGFESGLVEVSAPAEASPRAELHGHTAEVTHLALDGDQLTSSAADGQLRFGTVDGAAAHPPLSVPGDVEALAHGSGGTVLVSLSGGSYFIVDPEGGTVVDRQWPAVASQVFPAVGHYAAPSGDGQRVVLRNFTDDSVARAIDVSERLPDGVLGMIGGTHGHQLVVIERDPGSGIVVADLDGDRRQQLLDLTVLVEETTGTPPGQSFSWVPRPGADGERLFLAAATPEGGGPAAAWFDLADGGLVAGPTPVPTLGPAVVLPDGRVAMGDRFAPLIILPADLDGEPVIVEGSDGLRPYDFDPAIGRVAAVGGDGQVALIDPDTATMEPLEDSAGLAYAAAFSPDSRRLAVATVEGGVQILDIASGRRLGVPSGEGAAGIQAGNGLRWDDDGDGVWTALVTGPVRLSAAPGRWREIACGVVRRELTQQEWNTFVSDTDPMVPACPSPP